LRESNEGKKGRQIYMASQLIIKSPQPRKTALLIIVIAALFIGTGYGMYYIGHDSAGFDNAVLKVAHVTLQQQLHEIEKENSKLREKNAVLEQAAIIDKNAHSDVNGSLKQLQNEVLELKEQVAFYRGIVSPTETAAGLAIASFKLSKLGEESGYRFKLVLTQVKLNDRIIRGKATIFIDGLHNGEPKQFNVAALMGNTKAGMNLNFKYFQTIEGDMVLPEGFIPSSVLVDVKPSGAAQNALSQTFNWVDVIS